MSIASTPSSLVTHLLPRLPSASTFHFERACTYIATVVFIVIGDDLMYATAVTLRLVREERRAAGLHQPPKINPAHAAALAVESHRDVVEN